MTTPTKRGGKRAGAGRKVRPDGARRQQILSPSAAAYLRRLATAHYGRTPTPEEEAAFLSALVLTAE